MKPLLGYIPDAPDHRDYDFRKVVGLKKLKSNAGYIIPEVNQIKVKNQGATGSCVGHATASALELAWAVKYKTKPVLSPYFVYAMARIEPPQDQRKLTDVGTYLRSAVKSVKEHGVCDLSAWPSVLPKVNTKPHWWARRQAYYQRGIRGYYRIDTGDVHAIKQAIQDRMPVIFGAQVDENFMDQWGDDSIYLERKGRSQGGHAMMLYGFYEKEEYFHLQNSWGESWGDQGRKKVGYKYIEKDAQDIWAIDVGI